MKTKLGISIAAVACLTAATAGLGLAAPQLANAVDQPVTWYAEPGAPAGACPSRGDAHPAVPTINGAVACATAGDTIKAAAATFAENVTLTKDLTLVGASSVSTIIDGANRLGGGPVITVAAGVAATISDLTVRRGVNGIVVYGDATLTRVVSTANAASGLVLDTPGSVVLGPDFEIHRNGGDGVRVVRLGSGRVFANRPTLRSTGSVHDNGGNGVTLGVPYAADAPAITIQLGDADVFQNKGHGVFVRDDGGTNASDIVMLDNDVYLNSKSGLLAGRSHIGQTAFDTPRFAQNKFHSNRLNQVVFDGGGAIPPFAFEIDSPTGLCDAGANGIYSYTQLGTFGVFAQNSASVIIRHVQWQNGGTGLMDFSAQSGSLISVSQNCTAITTTP